MDFRQYLKEREPFLAWRFKCIDLDSVWKADDQGFSIKATALVALYLELKMMKHMDEEKKVMGHELWLDFSSPERSVVRKDYFKNVVHPMVKDVWRRILDPGRFVHMDRYAALGFDCDPQNNEKFIKEVLLKKAVVAPREHRDLFLKKVDHILGNCNFLARDWVYLRQQHFQCQKLKDECMGHIRAQSAQVAKTAVAMESVLDHVDKYLKVSQLEEKEIATIMQWKIFSRRYSQMLSYLFDALHVDRVICLDTLDLLQETLIPLELFAKQISAMAQNLDQDFLEYRYLAGPLVYKPFGLERILNNVLLSSFLFSQTSLPKNMSYDFKLRYKRMDNHYLVCLKRIEKIYNLLGALIEKNAWQKIVTMLQGFYSQLPEQQAVVDLEPSAEKSERKVALKDEKVSKVDIVHKEREGRDSPLTVQGVLEFDTVGYDSPAVHQLQELKSLHQDLQLWLAQGQQLEQRISLVLQHEGKYSA
jgi:hypothetical protein